MKALADFFPYVAPEVSGCPAPLMEDAIRRACIEFCQGSEYLRENFTADTVIGQGYVNLAPTTGDVVKVNVVEIDDEPLEKSRRADFPTDADSAEPAEYYLEEGGVLRLHPVPDAVYTLDIEAAVAPSDTATSVPDVLYKKHKYTIAMGAKALLMSMRSKPWTDDQGAAMNAAGFTGAIDKARSVKAKGGVGAPLRTRGHYF